MSAAGDVRVSKFSITFELQLYADSTAKAYELALQRLDGVILKHQRLRLGEALDGDTLPTGGIDGEPHGETLDGWRVVFTVKQVL